MSPGSRAGLRSPVLLIVSGPSGSGKDTLVSELRRLEPELAYSVSVTTRSRRRPAEIDGVHYHFVTTEEFQRLAAAGEFLETREYADNWYGTPRRFVDETLRSGRNLVMKPEVNGALAIKQAYPQAVLVFVTAPSEEILVRRLEGRQTEAEDTIAQRLQIARQETQVIARYDYLIVNDDVDTALEQLRAVLVAEGLRTTRLKF